MPSVIKLEDSRVYAMSRSRLYDKTLLSDK